MRPLLFLGNGGLLERPLVGTLPGFLNSIKPAARSEYQVL